MSTNIRHAFIIALLLVSVSSFAENKTIVLATAGAKPPLHTDNNTGFTDIVLKTAFDRIGYKLDIRVLPAERSLIASNRGIIDGEVQRIEGMTKIYPNLIRVPESIVDWKFVVFSKQEINTKKGWDSLKPYVTSYITGWKIFEINVPKDVAISKVRNSDGLFKLLNNDRTDLVLYELLQGLKHIKENSYKEIKAFFPPMASKKMYPYLHKKHVLLVPKLTKALKDMKEDGTYDQIYQRVIGQLE